MNPATAPTTPMMPAVPRKRRWWRGLLLLLALAVLTLAAIFGYSTFATEKAWREAEEEASRDLPRWRLMDMEADHAVIRDHENSAVLMTAITRKVGLFSIGDAPNYNEVFPNIPPNRQLNFQQIAFLRKELAKIAKPLAELRKLKGMPQGNFPCAYNDNYIVTQCPDQQSVRKIGEWLEKEAFLQAQDGQINPAVESCRAIFNGGHGVSGGPYATTYLIRTALQEQSLLTLERVLAQGEATDANLLAMQELVAQEMQAPNWLTMARGERAGMHHLFENIRDGKVSADFLKRRTVAQPGILDHFNLSVSEIFPLTNLRHYPDFLQHMNKSVEIAKLPLPERETRMKAWIAEIETSKNPLLTYLISPIYIHKVEYRSQAFLRTSLVALACERYRLKHETWPPSLDVLVQEKRLAELPTDPMDNQPLRYLRRKEGIVIHSIGIDHADNQGHIDREQHPNTSGLDIGFRLWNVNQRRQAPLPPVNLSAENQ